MSRDLDTSLGATLSNGGIIPAVLGMFQFRSGISYVWSGVGDLVYGGNTYRGVGALGKVSAIVEGVDVRADGMTVELSGIGTVPFVGLPPPSGVTPPDAPSAGQFVAWTYPTAVTASGVASYGSASATLDSAEIAINSSGTPQAAWSGFPMPALPTDAVVNKIIPVCVASGTGSGAFTGVNFDYPGFPSGDFSGQYAAPSIGSTPAALTSATVKAWLNRSLGGTLSQTLSISFIGIAVYYTSTSNGVSAINEALSDIQLGAPAKIWFGLMQDGALIGAPYLIFSGLVDQPTVETGVEASTIVLALENRLSDLSRPSARRYTAADQHLKYSDDTGFNWVEILNDIAERWGS